jgi:Fe-S cluster assembly ATP-binding protein
MLEIRNLHAQAEGKKILNGIDLKVNAGEVHAIMGPNGSGKSTLAQVLAGRDTYEVTAGEVFYQGHNLLEMAPEDRAHQGIFMAFQYPVEIPGVSNLYFLRSALNSLRKARGESELDALDFMEVAREKAKAVGLDESLLRRSINEGFSGGEKKRNEIFQMAVLEPKLGILDETDSGLDIDALKIVAHGVNSLRSPERGTCSMAADSSGPVTSSWLSISNSTATSGRKSSPRAPRPYSPERVSVHDHRRYHAGCFPLPLHPA